MWLRESHFEVHFTAALFPLLLSGAGSWESHLRRPKGTGISKERAKAKSKVESVRHRGLGCNLLGLILIPLSHRALDSDKLFVNGTIQTNDSVLPCSYKCVNPNFPSLEIGDVHLVKEGLRIPLTERV